MSNIKIKLTEKLGDALSEVALEKIEVFIANNLQKHQIDGCINLLVELYSLKKDYKSIIIDTLVGIDKTETEDYKNGWWDTAFGSAFGADKLNELIDKIDKIK